MLQLLATRAGQVVTREQLLAEVWPDTYPTNDVVTQAVTQLRKAFGGEAGGKGRIETIAKTGYRLLAAVSWEYPQPSATGLVPASSASADDDDRAVAVPIAVAKTSPRRRARGLFCLLLAFLCGLGVAALLRQFAERAARSHEAAADAMPVQRDWLITTSGKFDLSPTLSPDASMVAYTSWLPDRVGASILVKTTDNAPPRVLSRPAPGDEDGAPAWSPDGREIAFVRESPDGRCRVMIASANAAADEREVLRCADADTVSFSWSPDGQALLFGSMAGGGEDGAGTWHGIRRFQLRDGRWQALSYPTDARHLDYAPRYSPDGRWIAFLRNPQMGDVWLMPAAGGRAEPLTRSNAELRGLAWWPDGNALLFGRRTGNQWRLYRLELPSRRLRDLGLEDAQMPTISSGNGKLAFVQRKPRFGIYRVDRDKHGRFHQQRLFPSNGRDVQPMLAPNGRGLVFASDRSGSYRLWWADLSAATDARLIEGLLPETGRPVDWSADSQRLLLVAREEGDEASLYELMPALNRRTRLALPETRPLQAAYLADPSRLLVLIASDDGAAALALYDRSSRPWRQLRRLTDVSQVHVDLANNRVLFTRFSTAGLWRVDPSLDPVSVRAVDPLAPSRWLYRNWNVSDAGVIDYLASTATCSSFVSTLGPASAAPVGCVDPTRFSAGNGISSGGEGAALYLSLATEQGSGIAFMDLPEIAER